MKTAVKEQEANAAGESPVAQIPALLVAGGSCSRLCRSQRKTTEITPDTGNASAFNHDIDARRSARMKEYS